MWLNYMFPWFRRISGFALWSNIEKWKNWYKQISCNFGTFPPFLKLCIAWAFILYIKLFITQMIYRKTLQGEVIVHFEARVKDYSAICFHCFVWPLPLNQMDKQGTYGVWTGWGSQQACAVDSVACCCAFMFNFKILVLICAGAEARPMEP